MIINENTNKMTGQRSVFIQLDVSFSRVETRHWWGKISARASDATCVIPWIVRRCAEATFSQGTNYILDNIATYRQRWNLLNNAVVVVIGKQRSLAWVDNYIWLALLRSLLFDFNRWRPVDFLFDIYLYLPKIRHENFKLSRIIGKSFFRRCLFTFWLHDSSVHSCDYIWRN